MKALKTERDYKKALLRIDELIDAKPDTPEMDELEIMGLLVDIYEHEHYAIDVEGITPVTMLKHYMEHNHLSQTDVGKVIGGDSRISEILNYKRKLTLDMIRKLNNAYRIPLSLLIQDYECCKYPTQIERV